MPVFSRLLFAAPLIGLALPALSQATASFEIKQNCSPGTPCPQTISAVQADFNNDGKPDLLTADEVGSGSLAFNILFNLRLGNGDGTFQSPVQVGSTNKIEPSSLLAADLNHDGILDIVASSYGSRTDIFYGTGGGALGPPVTLPTTNYITGLAVTGDFNGDGLIDIAVGDFVGTIQILQNQGNKTFTLAATIPVANQAQIVSLASGDVDHDGKSDLAVADSNNVTHILWGLGNNTFNDVTLNAYETRDTGSTRMSIGDLNQDGSDDLMVSYDCNPSTPRSVFDGINPQCTGIDVYYGGQGRQATSLRRAVTDNSVDTTRTLQAVDINGDGIADLIAGGYVLDRTLQGLVVWFGHSDGSFSQTAQQFLTTSNANNTGEIITGDFNRDGRMDFFQVLTGISALYTNATATEPCLTSQISPTVTACQPVDNTYLPGPYINLQSTAYDKTQVTALQEYADGKLVYSQPVTGFNITLPETLGTHLLVTKAWDANGASFRSNRHVTVYSGTPGAVCSAAPNSASLCLPSGATAKSPVHILANGATSAVPTAAQLYVDGSLLINDTSQSTVIDTNEVLSTGNHELVFKLYDANGVVSTASKSITVQ